MINNKTPRTTRKSKKMPTLKVAKAPTMKTKSNPTIAVKKAPLTKKASTLKKKKTLASSPTACKKINWGGMGKKVAQLAEWGAKKVSGINIKSLLQVEATSVKRTTHWKKARLSFKLSFNPHLFLLQPVSGARHSTIGDQAKFNATNSHVLYHNSDVKSLKASFLHMAAGEEDKNALKKSKSDVFGILRELEVFDSLVLGGDPDEILDAFPLMIATAATLSSEAQTTLTTNLMGLTLKLTGGKLPGTIKQAPGGKMRKTKEEVLIYLSLIQVRSLSLFFYLLSFPTLSTSWTPWRPPPTGRRQPSPPT